MNQRAEEELAYTESDMAELEAKTIERCAQALEPLMQEILGEGDDYAMGVNDTVRQGQAAIHALKDQP